MTAEENIQQNGFWKVFFIRLYKAILDVVHVRGMIFIVGTILAARFMASYLTQADKTPNQWLGIAVVAAWLLLAIGLGWNRTWEKIFDAACEALKNWKKAA